MADASPLVESLDLAQRTKNVLRINGIETVAQLETACRVPGGLQIHGIGPDTTVDILYALHKAGVAVHELLQARRVGRERAIGRNAMFTDEQVVALRYAYHVEGSVGINQIARRHHVSRTTVWAMLSGSNYKHIPVPEADPGAAERRRKHVRGGENKS